jgi:hypothetical protein
MRLKFTLIIFIYALLANESFAQTKRYPKYSFGVGAGSGIGRLHESLTSAAILGLKADYQANPISWFSMRLEVGYLFMLNSMNSQQFSGSYNNGNEVVFYNNTLETLANTRQFYLSFAPVFYYREGKVNLFCGLAGGLGTGRLTVNQTLQINSSDVGQDTQHNSEQEQFFAVGYAPFIGFSYGLGKKHRPHGELEIKVAKETCLMENTKANPFNSALKLNALALQFTYRFLLIK